MKLLLSLIFYTGILFAGDTIIVATESWPPFRIPNGKELEGIDVDLLKEIGDSLEVTFKIVQYPWVRCLSSMQEGTVDLMSGVAWTEERAKYIQYSDSVYFRAYPAFYTLRDSYIRIKEYTDLDTLKIGYTRSSAYFPLFDNDTTLDKYDVSGEKYLIKMLLAKRIDTFIGTDCQVDFDLRELGLKRKIIRQPYKPDSGINLYVGISKRSAFMKRWPEFNRILEVLIEKKRPQELYEKHTSEKK